MGNLRTRISVLRLRLAIALVIAYTPQVRINNFGSTGKETRGLLLRSDGPLLNSVTESKELAPVGLEQVLLPNQVISGTRDRSRATADS
jgi:hypothetical protein